ncbi:hypothetical protein FSOLCH5_003688 [Fusarium solani]
MSSMDLRPAKRRKAANQSETQSSAPGSWVGSFESPQSFSSYLLTPTTTSGATISGQALQRPTTDLVAGAGTPRLQHDAVQDGRTEAIIPVWDPATEDMQYFPPENFEGINIEELVQSCAQNLNSVEHHLELGPDPWLIDNQETTQQIPVPDIATDDSAPTGGNTWSDFDLFPVPKWPTFRNADDDKNRKRVREIAELEHRIDSAEMADLNNLALMQTCAMLFPSVPNSRDKPQSVVPNPFMAGHEERFITLEGRAIPRVPEGGMIDGYIKVQVSNMFTQDVTSPSSLSFRVGRPSERSRLEWPQTNTLGEMAIPPLPRNFATGLELNAIDRSLWVFRRFHPERFNPQKRWFKNAKAY